MSLKKYKNKDFLFIRWGGLSPQKQTHRKTQEKDRFHRAPRKYGFFAFPYPYVDKFLLGATSAPNHITGKTYYLKDTEGNKLTVRNYDYQIVKGKEVSKYDKLTEKLLRKNKVKHSDVWIETRKNEINCEDNFECEDCPMNGKCNTAIEFVTVLKKPRIFKHKGFIWSHFKEIALQEEILDEEGAWIKTDFETYVKLFERIKKKYLKEIYNEYSKDLGFIRRYDPFIGRGITYCKDELEVFIERLK